jgi:hypothetical protein
MRRRAVEAVRWVTGRWEFPAEAVRYLEGGAACAAHSQTAHFGLAISNQQPPNAGRGPSALRPCSKRPVSPGRRRREW